MEWIAYLSHEYDVLFPRGLNDRDVKKAHSGPASVDVNDSQGHTITPLSLHDAMLNWEKDVNFTPHRKLHGIIMLPSIPLNNFHVGPFSRTCKRMF
jgi:hypothetical protein